MYKFKKLLIAFAGLLFLIGVIALVAPTTTQGKGSVTASPAAPSARLETGITGRGSVLSGGFTPWEVTALVFSDGSVQGHFRTPVISASPTLAVPPSPGNPFWCIEVDFPDFPGFVYLAYIADTGDGKTSFDEIGASTGRRADGVSCAAYPQPCPFSCIFTLDDGNFKTIP